MMDKLQNKEILSFYAKADKGIGNIPKMYLEHEKTLAKYKTRVKTKYVKGKTVYKTRYKDRYVKPIHKKEPKRTTPINLLKYKDNLYMVSTPGNYGEQPKLIQAKTKVKAIEVYRKFYKFIDSVEIIAVDFDQFDIIK